MIVAQQSTAKLDGLILLNILNKDTNNVYLAFVMTYKI